ncbi:hypothetical protein [Thiolapillus sp.]|uniref:hypothetical protein n=1 Tax=Thiolapillus sp. TaxID=2017437 RepID=UPI003AF718F3
MTVNDEQALNWEKPVMTTKADIGRKAGSIIREEDSEQRLVYWRFGMGLTVVSIFMLMISSRLDQGGQLVFGGFSIISFLVGVYHVDKSIRRKGLKQRIREILSRWV